MPLNQRTLFNSFLISLLSISNLYAQVPDKDCDLCQNGSHNEERPYELSFRQEIPYIVTSALSLSAGFIAQAANNERFLNIGEINQLNKEDVFSFDRSAIGNNSQKAASYSDFFRTSITLLPIYFVSNHHTKEDIWPLVAMSLEVLTTTYGLTNLTKNVARRSRPFTYNDNVPLEKKLMPDAKRSFFSGHTSHTAAFAFFMAKVVTDYHPNMKKGLKATMWGGAILIPATTAYLRVKAGRHFPTDVIAGYATGALVGFLIPHLHKKKDTESIMSWNPIVLDDYAGLSLSIKLGHRTK